MSANHFLLELAERVKDFSKKVRRKFYLIAESNLNDVRVIRPKELGGYGLDAQWCDDFHHSLHALLTDEKTGYYIDFGEIKHLVKAFKEGFVYSWQYSTYRKRHHGSSSKDRPSYQFIIFSQNHDQVGNRMLGERLSKLVSFEGLKLAAGAVIFSPYIPLLFMGEEYGEEVPFTYFVNHSDQDLIAAVREGRKKEFKAFKWQKEPLDPQDPKTFLQSKLKWGKRKEGKHKVMLEFYCQLIKLRKQNLTLKNLGKKTFKVLGIKEQKLILLHRWYNKNQVFMIMNFNQKDSHFIVPKGKWKKLIDSSEKKWMGPGSLLPKEIEEQKELNISPLSFALYEWR
jgi:maltooligosyltrehalose trehalohydrolase